MKDIQYLQKDDKVSTGSSGSYKAMSEEKVTQIVRESLITHGLVILPVAQTHCRNELRDKENILKGYLSIVDTQYKIVDIETGQFELLASSGTGADSQDKGVGKAMTYSYKYLLLRTFAIPTGDDPDKVSSASLDEQHELEKSKRAAEDAKKLPALQAKWQTLAGSLDGFNDWHMKQKNNGVTNEQMNELLAKKLLERTKESA
ncbi:ERF family protein [Cohnella nanjingensis]|nr:ERF family protein [Cohnella nanjingensis]